MILSRVLSFFFRFAEFVSAAVVLGIAAHFLNVHEGPRGREIYTIVLAALSAVLSLLWLLPRTSALLHVPADLIFSAGWFAAFGILVNWMNGNNCGRAFQWGGIYRGGRCNEWRASQAFAFLSAVFWLCSALLGCWVHHKVTRGDRAVVDQAPRRRRRWV